MNTTDAAATREATIAAATAKARAYAEAWTPARVTPDEGRTILTGQMHATDRWNGWRIVRLNIEETRRMLAAITAATDPGDPDGTTYREETDDVGRTAFVVVQHDDEEDTYTVDDRGWYYVGAWAWCWEDAAGYEACAAENATEQEV